MTNNIFQAKFMPFTDGRKIVTSSADCQVRLSQLLENGSVETKRLSKHQGRVHKLAVEPGSPRVFYSCGEDGLVQHYDLRMGGADVYARVYDIRKYELNALSNKEGGPVNTFCPRHLIKAHRAHITALAYSNASELLVSYNDELVYLFRSSMGLGPNDDDAAQVYSGHRNKQTVKGVSFFGPNDEYVLSGSDCGHIFVWRKKGGELLRMMVGDRHIVNQIEPHPLIPVLASCGIEKNVKIWSPSSKAVSPLPETAHEIMESNRQDREDDSLVTQLACDYAHLAHTQEASSVDQ